ncbi:MAG: TetR/AcrR family transcriptional regulator [Proteobacteria bacterium]|jgi:AcrR family transcriptional regulator|nr:TetR/AcrR family transcriptional regulator [Pseudomonadota bacterium]
MSIGEPRFINYVPGTSKDERYHRVALAVVTILLRRRPQEVTVSAVARRAKVSRPWIYKYFGRETDSLLGFTVKYFGEAFNELDEEPFAHDSIDQWRQYLVERTNKALDDVESAPWLMLLYFRYRHDAGPIGVAMREIEQLHLDRFLASVPAELRRRRGNRRLERFARAFSATRNGVYFRWVDSGERSAWNRAELIDEIMRPVDAFVAWGST